MQEAGVCKNIDVRSLLPMIVAMIYMLMVISAVNGFLNKYVQWVNTFLQCISAYMTPPNAAVSLLKAACCTTAAQESVREAGEKKTMAISWKKFFFSYCHWFVCIHYYMWNHAVYIVCSGVIYCSFQCLFSKDLLFQCRKAKNTFPSGENKSSFYHYNLLNIMKYFIKHNWEMD